MDSYAEAFAKLRTWERSNTRLKLTMIPKGQQPEILSVEITAVDEEGARVSFITPPEQRPRAIDMSDASFVVGAHVLEASRPTGDLLAFAEIGVD